MGVEKRAEAALESCSSASPSLPGLPHAVTSLLQSVEQSREEMCVCMCVLVRWRGWGVVGSRGRN